MRKQACSEATYVLVSFFRPITPDRGTPLLAVLLAAAFIAGCRQLPMPATANYPKRISYLLPPQPIGRMPSSSRTWGISAQEADDDIRRRAALGLANANPPPHRARAVLEKAAAEDSDKDIRRFASEALKAINATKHAPPPR